MEKINILKKELDEMVVGTATYDEILKKSRELDRYITKEMKKMHPNIVKVIKI